jgi:hypothetical protein
MSRKGVPLTQSFCRIQEHSILPLNIVDHIAKFLVDDNKHATAAALNICNKEFHACTLATLWKTVYVKANGGMATFGDSVMWKRVTESKGRSHVQ